MNLLAPISEIMNCPVISLSETDTIAQAAEIFHQKKIHHIPIVKNEELIGIISKSDFLFFKRGFLESTEDQTLENIRLHHHKVNEIMTTGIATLEPEDKINVAIAIFCENLFHAIPIVKNKKLVGIVSTYDIIKQLNDKKVVINQYQLNAND